MKKILKSQKKELLLAGGIALLCLILTLLFSRRIDPAPPRSVTFAAGPEGGAYYEFAQRYAKRLAPKGLTINVLATGGSVENLRLLRAGEADIGFVQSGLGADSESLKALGSTFFEPLWLFTRTKEPVQKVTELIGKTVAIGSNDSGTREVALAVLRDTKMEGKLKTLSIDGEEAHKRLLAGTIDAAFYVGSPSVESIRSLANEPEIQIANFRRVQAYSRYHSSLSHVTLYAGMLNLAEDVPKEDKQLLATAANLVVTEQFHYALTTLFLQTAQEIHGEAGAFQSYGEFPSPRYVSLPLVPEAERFYRSGPSFFFRHLPFFWAATVDRLIILLLPVLTLLLPLIRFLPPFYGWMLRRRLFKRQEELREVELNTEEQTIEERLEKLEALEAELPELKQLPAAYQNDVFLLQLRLEKVKESIQRSNL